MKRSLAWVAVLALAVASCDKDPVRPSTAQKPIGPDRLLVATGLRATEVSAANEHTCARTIDGTIACWGNNTYGEAAPPSDLGTVAHVSAGYYHSCAVKTEGTVVCWGYDGNGQVTPPSDLGTVTQVGAGYRHTCAVKTDGMVACWGNNVHGEATPPTDLGPVMQVSVGSSYLSFHTCAVKSDGTVACWGYNHDGQATPPPSLGPVTQVSVGGYHTCAVKIDGTVVCWGQNVYGEAMVLSDLGAVTQLSAAGIHNCAVKIDGKVTCWSLSVSGQEPPNGLAPFTQVSTGEFHACALTVDGTVACWGNNYYGQAPPPLAERVLPTADFTAPSPVNEGSSIQLSLANAQVPGFTGDADFTYAFDCGDGAGYRTFGPSNTASCLTTDDGTRTVKGTVKDKDGDQTEFTGTVTINNVAPLQGEQQIIEIKKLPPGQYLELGGFFDPGSSDTWTGTVDYDDGSGVHPLSLSIYPPETQGEPAWGYYVLEHQYLQNGTYTVTVTIRDDDGGTLVDQRQATISNIEPGYTPPGENITVTPTDETTGAPSPVEVVFPSVTPNADGSGGTTTVTSAPVGQGGGGAPEPGDFRLGSPPTSYDITTTATFPTGSEITVCISWQQGEHGTDQQEAQLKLLHFDGTNWVDITMSPPYPDVVNNRICGKTTSFSWFIVAEQNFAPVVTGIALPSVPNAVGVTVPVTATFTDQNPGDTHTGILSWNDGATSAGQISEANGTGSVTGSHVYQQPGVYTVTVTVNDNPRTGSRQSTLDVPAYVVVYDAAAGFVTGGGWISSPANACDASLCSYTGEGKASFGFVAKYVAGRTLPDGNTRFQFHAGGLDFQSTSYETLVVSGNRAQFWGAGTVNRVSGYTFRLTAVDGQTVGNDGTVDKFRIEIWASAGNAASTGALVYDNQRGAAQTDALTTSLGGGSITIRK